jgi:hypothetical protein
MAIPDVQRHALTGRGVESNPDLAECFTHVRDQVQVIDKVTAGRKTWPPSSHPYQEQGDSCNMPHGQ